MRTARRSACRGAPPSQKAPQCRRVGEWQSSSRTSHHTSRCRGAPSRRGRLRRRTTWFARHDLVIALAPSAVIAPCLLTAALVITPWAGAPLGFGRTIAAATCGLGRPIVDETLGLGRMITARETIVTPPFEALMLQHA